MAKWRIVETWLGGYVVERRVGPFWMTWRDEDNIGKAAYDPTIEGCREYIALKMVKRPPTRVVESHG